MQKFVCAIGLFALVLILLELLVCVEGSRVRVLKVKKTRHDKRQALTGYDRSVEDVYDDEGNPISRVDDSPYLSNNVGEFGTRRNSPSRSQSEQSFSNNYEDDSSSSRQLTGEGRNFKRQSPEDGHTDGKKDKEDGCLGCGNNIPGNPGDYPTFASPPKTSFDCKKQEHPGYYADPETQCQVFWICQAKRQDAFLCPNGTVFNQQVLVCDWWFNVDCTQSSNFYSRNQFLYAGPGVAVNGDKIQVYSGPQANSPDVIRPTRRTQQQLAIANQSNNQGIPSSSINVVSGNRATRNNDNYAIDDENANFPLATNDRQRDRRPEQQPRNYNKRDNNVGQRFTIQPDNISRQTTRQTEDQIEYTTQSSLSGSGSEGYSTGSSGSIGGTGSYGRVIGVTSSVAYSNKQSKNPHPFLSQGTYPAQVPRQTTPTTVTPRREYSGRSIPLQSPNAIPFPKEHNNKPQQVADEYTVIKKNAYTGKNNNQQRPYYETNLERQPSQRYNYESEAQRLPTTTKRNTVNSDLDKEYNEDGFDFHFAKIPAQKTFEIVTVVDKQTSPVAVTTYKPSTVTSSPKIFTSQDNIAVSPPNRHIDQHPKYDEDDMYTTSAPAFGKKVKSGRKRNTANWTSYFRKN